jgi:hypothetical protein
MNDIDVDVSELLELDSKLQNKPIVLGKGRKTCPSCNNIIGARTVVCNCGHDFTKAKEEKSAREIPGHYVGGKIIYTPTGSPPVKLNEATQEAVEQWCSDILAIGREQFYTYSPEAIIYYLRTFYKPDTKEYENCKQWIWEWDEKGPFKVSKDGERDDATSELD